jgi:hypothetical protein
MAMMTYRNITGREKASTRGKNNSNGTREGMRKDKERKDETRQGDTERNETRKLPYLQNKMQANRMVGEKGKEEINDSNNAEI